MITSLLRKCILFLIVIALHPFHIVTPAEALDEKECNAAEETCPTNAESSPKTKEDVTEMTLLQDAVRECKDMKCILTELVTDEFFRLDCWEKKPVLLRTSGPETLGKGRLDWKTIIELTNDGLMWGNLGENCIVHPDVKNGTAYKLDSYFKGSQMTPEQFKKLKHTIHIGSIQSIHRGAAELVLHFQRALGMAANGNVLISKGMKVIPLHTDRFDMFVIQTSGRKRWKIYEPHTENPVWGVHGEGQWGKDEPLPFKIVGSLLLDVILEPGDVLYIPRGFPRYAETVYDKKKKNAPSIDIAISMHTEGLHLVYEKYVRCAFLRAGACDEVELGENYCPLGRTLTEHVRSNEGKALRKAMPVGFLSGSQNYWPYFAKEVGGTVQKQLVMVLKKADKKGMHQSEELLKRIDEELPKVAGLVFKGVQADIKVLEEEGWYGNNEEISFYEKQKHFMRLIKHSGPFQGTACHANGTEVAFRDYFDDKLKKDEFTRLVKKG